MDLEITNAEYLVLKEKMDSIKAEIDVRRKDLKTLNEDKDICKGKILEAKRKGHSNKEEKNKEKLEEINKKIDKIKKELEDKKNDANLFKKLINEKIEEIRKDPSSRQAMDEALQKRFSRKINKLQQDKVEKVSDRLEKQNEQDRYNELKKIITEHPTLKNNLNGILAAKEEINKIDKELEKIDYKKEPEKYAELSAKAKEANNKLNKNKEPLMNYIDKNKIDIRYEDIEKMADSGLGLDETIKNLGKDIKKYDKEIKQCDEQIRKYQIAKGNLGQEMTQENNELQELRQQQQPQQPQLQQGADKPKWYQFGKRIKNWIEQRKQAKLPEPSSAIPQNRPNTMRNALRYNILRDEFEKETGTRLKMAEKERKQEQQAREQQKPEGNER